MRTLRFSIPTSMVLASVCMSCAMHSVYEEPGGETDSPWEYELIITSVWDHSLNAVNTERPLYPDDDEYVDVDDGPRYLVRFGDNTVEIAGHDLQDRIVGTLGNVGGTFDSYDLDLWAGGRLTIWFDGMDSAQALLEIDGSGVPVIGSERGILVPLEGP